MVTVAEGAMLAFHARFVAVTWLPAWLQVALHLG